MEDKLLTPQEVADILKIRKNTVYDMIKRGDLHATKMGKQFRILQSDVDWIIKGSTAKPEIASPVTIGNSATGFSRQNALTKISPFDMSLPDNNITLLNQENINANTVILCGQDILLDILCNHVNSNPYGSQILRSYLGSYNGLYAMYQGQVHIATAHLWDYKTDTYNVTYIDKLLPGEDVVMIHLAYRMQGFYVQKGNPKNIRGIDDFRRNDIQFINREKGSGTRVLFDGLCRLHGISPELLPGASRVVSSHLSAASAVARGSADFAMGNERTTLLMREVDFIPYKQESYDLVIRKKEMERPLYQDLVRMLNTPDFQAEISALGGYDVTDMGKQIL